MSTSRFMLLAYSSMKDGEHLCLHVVAVRGKIGDGVVCVCVCVCVRVRVFVCCLLYTSDAATKIGV